MNYGEAICKSKKKYKSRKSAWESSYNFFKDHGWYNTPYKCTYCKGIHLTQKRAHPQPSKEFVKMFNKWFGREVL